MDELTNAQVAALRKLGDVQIALVEGDAPYVRLASGKQLCSDGVGAYDVWDKHGRKPVRMNLSLDEAKALIGGAL